MGDTQSPARSSDMDKRYYALDALRASMMLLGLIFHTLVSYTTERVSAYQDGARTPFADTLVAFLHSFRIPIFFIMAGFFAAMLYLKRGPAGLASNRVVRIVIPFVIGWMILHPLVIGGATFANTAQARSVDFALSAVGNRLLSGAFLFRNNTMHLWFLYYLLYFYVLALLLAGLARRLPAAWRATATEFFESIVSRPILRVSILAVATTGVLLPVGGLLPISNSFVPDVAALVSYGFFFFFGWALFFSRDLVLGFRRFALTQTVAAVAIFLVGDLAIRLMTPQDQGVLRSAIGGVVVWTMFFGLSGLFLRYLDRPSPAVRYVVDSSYWVYLIHLPFTFWVPGLLSGQPWSPWAKIVVVVSVTSLICFVTYDLLVRSTAIGALLNGRRYPSALLSGRGINLEPGKA